MSANSTPPNQPPPAQRWRLWIDGCGGFLLLGGKRWSVGGFGQHDLADICIRADLPRCAGWIERQGDDYFWQGAQIGDARMLLASKQSLPIQGSASAHLSCPSPLSCSASLLLSAPHRFDEHVDGVVLVDETLLIGPHRDCHIHSRLIEQKAVITRRDSGWFGRVGITGEFMEIPLGHRIQLDNLAMTLELA